MPTQNNFKKPLIKKDVDYNANNFKISQYKHM